MGEIHDVKKDQQKCGDCRQAQHNATTGNSTERLEDRQASDQQQEQTQDAHIPQIETKSQQKRGEYLGERMTLGRKRQVQTKA